MLRQFGALLVLLVVGLATQACGPERPENAIVEDFGCFELQHLAGYVAQGEAHFGEIIVRGEVSPECPNLAKIEYSLFADANGNGAPDESEILLSGAETYAAFTTSARLYATASGKQLDAFPGKGPLRYRITLTDSTGAKYVSDGLCPE